MEEKFNIYKFVNNSVLVISSMVFIFYAFLWALDDEKAPDIEPILYITCFLGVITGAISICKKNWD